MMPCATCGMLFEVRRKDHRFCSAKCRLVGFQHEREAKLRERDAKVRLLLGEALGLLEPEKEPVPWKSASTMALGRAIRRGRDLGHGEN